MNIPDNGQHNTNRFSLAAWCLYDFANSAFTTIIVTFVFATYFATGIAANEETGATQWSTAMAIAGLLIAALSPIFGAIADQTGRKKPWLLGVSVACVSATALLWFAEPRPEDVPWALTFAVIATVGFEMGMLFYNAMLPDVAKPNTMGRVSGWAWGLGYAGGLLSLALALFGFVQTDSPLFGFTTDNAEHVRATSLVVAVWFIVFALPLFLFVKEPARTELPIATAVRRGFHQLISTFREIRRHKNLFRYLIAAMIYTDGVHTIFTLGGVYAGVTLGMELDEVIMLGIALNVTAGLGAFAFGWMDDKRGSKTTIVVSLVALIATSSVVLMATDLTTFWIAALAMSTFFGPVQAASRTMMARIAPPTMRGEMFGLFALSGKVTAFAGPAIVALIADVTGNFRFGMMTVLIFLVVGLLLMRSVKEIPELSF